MSKLYVWIEELIAATACEAPVPHRANINVDELAHRIVANTTRLEAQGRIAQSAGSHARNPDVDRLGQHVLRVLRNAGLRGTRAQEIVGPRSPVTADDVDYAILPAKLGQNAVQNVELPRIVAAHILGPMVTKKVIQLRDSRRDVPIANAIDHVQIFPGVQVVQVKFVPLIRGVKRTLKRFAGYDL